jgi:hypothetical protein
MQGPERGTWRMLSRMSQGTASNGGRIHSFTK